MSLPDLLPIQPFTHPVQGEVFLPGSKSLTNRALLAAALCPYPVQLGGALFSEDTKVMQEALQRLGINILSNSEARTFSVSDGGPFPKVDSAEIFVGNAGTAARFLTAYLALHPSGTFRLDGVPAMRERPMEGLLRALEEQGTRFEFHGKEWHFPFTLRSNGLRGGVLSVEAKSSSQIISALLLVAPYAKSPLWLKLSGMTVSQPFIAMTLGLMRDFGIPVNDPGPVHQYQFPVTGIQLPHSAYRGPIEGNYSIEPDATAASYFAMLPVVVGGGIHLKGLIHHNGLQGDTLFLNLLEGKQRRAGPETFPFNLSGDYNPFSDTFLTAAAVAPLCSEQTEIKGIGHTRHQETDRVKAMATELTKLGAKIMETEDSLTIFPVPDLKEKWRKEVLKIDTYEDHRIAMSFAILGAYDLRQNGEPWLAIKNPGCCAKTFPTFFQMLDSLRT